MGGGSKTETTNQTQSNTIDPQQFKLLQDNYAGAQGRANSLTPYSGPLTAGFNPAQTQAQGILGAVGTDPTYGATADTAIGTVQGVLGNPQTASQIGDTDLSKYLNPFTNDVINASINDNERARELARVANQQHSTGANAFGGSRAGVADALTNEAYDRNNQTNIAGLNAANFTQAQNAAGTDVASQNAMKQFNTNTALTGATNLSNLNAAKLGLATTQGGILGAVGDAQQAQSQKEIDDVIAAYQSGQQLTLAQQNILNSALGLIPTQQTVTSSGTNVSKTNSGLGGILGSVGSIASAAGPLIALSDARTKSDVRTLYHDEAGHRWVSFRYNWEEPGTSREGVIAQEILKTDPDAVIMGDDGFYRVNYSKLKGVH